MYGMDEKKEDQLIESIIAISAHLLVSFIIVLVTCLCFCALMVPKAGPYAGAFLVGCLTNTFIRKDLTRIWQ